MDRGKEIHLKNGQIDNCMSENVLPVDNTDYITDLRSKNVGQSTTAPAAMKVLIGDVCILAYVLKHILKAAFALLATRWTVPVDFFVYLQES